MKKLDQVLNVALKLILALVGAAVALIPFWIALGAWQLMDPTGFWERFAVVGSSLIVLGGPQVVLSLLYLKFLFEVIIDA